MTGLTDFSPPGWDRSMIYEGGYRGSTFWRQGTAVSYGRDAYSTDTVISSAIRFLTAAPATKPVFLMLTPYAPHANGAASNWLPSPATRYAGDPRCSNIEPWRGPAFNEADVSDKPNYIRNLPSDALYPQGWPLDKVCESLLSVDDLFARVKAEMERQGRSNTLYVLTDDNGMAFGDHRWPTKSVPYATPADLFVHWAGHSMGTLADRTTSLSNIDFAPTLCALAGCVMGPYPDGYGVDGVSFAPLLVDPNATIQRDYLFVESPPQSGTSPDSTAEISDAGTTTQAYLSPAFTGVRTTASNPMGRYEYTRYADGECELYDLVNDPFELDNQCNNPSFAVKQAVLEGYRLQAGNVPASSCVSSLDQCLTIDPVTADFGSATRGSISGVRTFTVTNSGTDDVRVGAISLLGSSPNPFVKEFDPCAGRLLEPGDTCSMSVSFRPAVAGLQVATLRVSPEAGAGAVDANLSGMGVVAGSTGAITVAVDAKPNSSSDVRFGGTLGGFSLDDDGNAVLSNRQSFTNLAPGTYDITQLALPGWAVTRVSCAGGGSPRASRRTAEVNLAGGQNVTCTFLDELRRPDAAVALASDRRFVGGNVHANTVLPSQTKQLSILPGQTRSLLVAVQNDGLSSDSMMVHARFSGSKTLAVHFLNGAADITSQVVAGTYTVRGLAPGATVIIEVRATALGVAPAGVTRDVDVEVTSTSAPAARDIVRGHLIRS